MSNLERDPVEAASDGVATLAATPVRELLPARDVVLGGVRGLAVRRTLPNRDRRMVGAWCFLDHFGPDDVAGGRGMRVPPHPHTSLQTVTWLVEGEVRHRDSLGNDQLIRPGQLNLMTAGRGIAHAEDSPAGHGPVLHGVQLWVALPLRHRMVEPAFAHHDDLPVRRGDGATVRVLMGELGVELDGELGGELGGEHTGGPFGRAASPARTYSPLVAAEITLATGATARLSLEPTFEHAVLTLTGAVEVDGVALVPGPLLYLGRGRSQLTLAPAPASASAPDAAHGEPPRTGQVLLLGGEPFEERIVMWWNFVGASHEEIVAARADWTAGRGFGEVRGYDGAPLPAPDLPTTRLLPRPRHR